MHTICIYKYIRGTQAHTHRHCIVYHILAFLPPLALVVLPGLRCSLCCCAGARCANQCDAANQAGGHGGQGALH